MTSTVLDKLDAAAARRWCSSALETLQANRARLDRLNVFPVPDGDTGNNLTVTMQAAHDGMRAEKSSNLGDVLTAMAEAAARGAHGNSGVIFSQILAGVASACTEMDADARVVAAAFAAATARAYRAVAEPTEGTMLSVVAAAANAAGAVVDAAGTAEVSLALLVQTAGDAAAAALDRSPDQLAVLAEAGVVDSGGLGLVLVLDCLIGTVTDTWPKRSFGIREMRDAHTGQGILERARESGSAEFGYEVQYLLNTDGSGAAGSGATSSIATVAAAISTLRADLAALGDSLVVVEAGADLWNVHVHVNDIGAAIEAGIAAGRPQRITVTRFEDQHLAPSGGEDAVCLLALVPDAGIGALFEAEGVATVEIPPDLIDSPGGLDRVSELIRTALHELGAPQIVVFPNTAELTSITDTVAAHVRSAGVGVAVLPTRSPVQGLSAVAVHLDSRRVADDVIAMAEAAAATRWAEVQIADTEAMTMAGRCQPGDALGLIEGEVVEIGEDPGAVAADLVERLLRAGGELITVLLGDGAEPAAVVLIEDRIGALAPHAEVNVLPITGSPRVLLIGVE